MKSSWTCCLIVASLLLGASAGPAAERDRRGARSPDELINIYLSPSRAQWLVGPIARLASEEEIAAFLAITDDAAAERFIAEFWSTRRPLEGVPGLSARQQFEHLAEEADRLYGEETYPGRRTDRGTIFILYGPPDEVDYQPARKVKYGEIEVWRYAKGRLGLDGRAPLRSYHFIQDGDLTRFARPLEMPKLIP